MATLKDIAQLASVSIATYPCPPPPTRAYLLQKKRDTVF